MLSLMLSIVTDDQRELIEGLFREYKTLFFGVAMRILQNHHAAEDAVSDAFIRITQNITKISQMERHKMRAYCVVIVENCARSHLRKDGRLQYTDTPELISDLAAPDPAIIAEQNEIQKRMHNMLDILQQEDKRLLLMRYEHGASYREIATVLGMEEATVRKRAERALTKLRDQIKEEYE